jgi:hypothetical protein
MQRLLLAAQRVDFQSKNAVQMRKMSAMSVLMFFWGQWGAARCAPGTRRLKLLLQLPDAGRDISSSQNFANGGSASRVIACWRRSPSLAAGSSAVAVQDRSEPTQLLARDSLLHCGMVA